MKDTLPQKPTGLIISGHPRSGTTILNKLMTFHKDIALSFEFNAFWNMGMSHEVYVEKLRKTWRKKRLISAGESSLSRLRWKAINRKFYETFTGTINQYAGGIIGYDQIIEAYQKALPGMPIVGDKRPPYVFILDRLVTEPGLKKIVIYRNCPNVVRSCLARSLTKGPEKPFSMQYGTAEKAATSWVKAIDMLEAYRDQLFIVRYEDLIGNPQKEVTRIAEYLAISPAGFRTEIIRSDQPVKHIYSLTEEDNEIIRAIAGPTMERLGYL